MTARVPASSMAAPANSTASGVATSASALKALRTLPRIAAGVRAAAPC